MQNKNPKKVSYSVEITEPVIPTSEPVGNLSTANSALTGHTSVTTDSTALINSTTVVCYPSSSTSSSSSLHPPPQITIKPVFSAIADYEELPDVASPLARSMTMQNKHFNQRQTVIENEYVPSPENSPLFKTHRLRSNTVASSGFHGHTSDHAHQGGVAHHFHHPVSGTSDLAVRMQPLSSQQQQLQFGEYLQFLEGSNDYPAQNVRKHLSVVSMESGLGFGYDVEKDFNPSLSLETQPWFHGKISRADAEILLHDDGEFVVRENASLKDTYTLTFRWNGAADHTLIGTTEVMSTSGPTVGTKLGVKYQFDGGAFDSIPELIYNHIKYQIPVEKNKNTIITSPICRSGSSGRIPQYASSFSGNAPSPDSSLHCPSPKGQSVSPTHPEAAHLLAMDRMGSISPNDSPRGSPSRKFNNLSRNLATPSQGRLSQLLSMSSGNLSDSANEDAVFLRNIISRSSDTGSRSIAKHHDLSPRHSVVVQGDAGVTDEAENHVRADSFGDYEVMGSVPLKQEPSREDCMSPRPRDNQEKQKHQQQPQQQHQKVMGSGKKSHMVLTDYSSLDNPQCTRESVRRNVGKDSVKYSEIRYITDPIQRADDPMYRSRSSSVNYTQVQFGQPRSMAGDSGSQSHQQSPLYDIVPSGRRVATLQSQGEEASRVFSCRLLQEEQACATPTSPTSPRPFSTPHQFGNYVTMVKNPSLSINCDATSSRPASLTASLTRIAQTDSAAHAPLRKTSSQDLRASRDSLVNSDSLGTYGSSSLTKKHIVGSSLLQSHTSSMQRRKSLPGYEALDRAHTILQGHSNNELAFHMTRADAVCFMLAPRPAEDKKIWKQR